MKLFLDHDEADLLREVLDGAYRDLKYEVASTDRSAYKARLRVREHRLRWLLDLAGGPLPDRSGDQPIDAGS